MAPGSRFPLPPVLSLTSHQIEQETRTARVSTDSLSGQEPARRRAACSVGGEAFDHLLGMLFHARQETISDISMVHLSLKVED